MTLRFPFSIILKEKKKKKKASTPAADIVAKMQAE